jgi:YfiH family protein
MPSFPHPVDPTFQHTSPESLRPAPAQPVVASNGAQFVTVPGWTRLPRLWHGFSTRQGGVTAAYAPQGAPSELNLGFTAEDEREHVLRNRCLLAEAVTDDPATPLVTLRQIHSDLLVVPEQYSAAQPPPPARKGDGIMTDQSGILLGVQTADCVPVLVADHTRKIVAAFHAGWRGTVRRIVENGIGRMRFEFGSRPEDLVAAIGPAIGPCCYSVGEEVLSEFQSQFSYTDDLFHEVGVSLQVDLLEANRRQLLAAGLNPESIQSAGGCTACQPQMFFSHRASRGRTGRMLSVIGIRPQ